MAYGFKFYTGPQGETTTEVGSGDVAPGFIVPASSSVTATVTNITAQNEAGQFVCTAVQFNKNGGYQQFQPGLQTGHLLPNAGVIISGPGLPANAQVIGCPSMPPQNGATYVYDCCFLVDKAPTGAFSTAADAYTITHPKRDFQFVAHPNDWITRLNNDLYNYVVQRPLPDTVLDFSDSPFTRHDIVVMGSPIFTGGQYTSGYGYWYRAAPRRPAYWVDQVNKKAYVNFHKNWQEFAEGVTISGSTGSSSTTVILAANMSVPIQQEMRVFGPGCGPLGIRVTRSLGSSYSQFTVESAPAGGWQYSSGLYYMTSGASTYDRIGSYGGETDYGFRYEYSANMYWKVAIIGRMI
jgi:hypothetical protein